MIYVFLATSFHIWRSPQQQDSLSARKDLLTQGSGTSQCQPVGGLQELTDDGIAVSLSFCRA